MKWTFIFSILIGLASCTTQKEESPDWSFTASGRIQSDPLIDNGIVYFGCNDSNFYALDANTGKEFWRINTGYKIRSQAAVQNNVVLFSSGNNLFALNKRTGEKIWVHTSTDTTGSDLFDPWDYHTSSPVINNSTVYTGFGNGLLLGFDVNTGNETFRFKSIGSSPLRSTPVVKNEVIYFGDWNGRIYAVDINTSDTIWTYKTYETQHYPTFGQVNTRLVIYDTLLLFGARNPEFQALSITNGEKVWSYIDSGGGWISGDPLVQGDTLYVGASDSHKLFAFDVYTGDIHWVYNFLFNNFSKPLISGNYLLFTSGDAYSFMGKNLGNGYLVLLDKSDKSILNMAHFEGNVFTSPVLYNGKIFVSGDDMKIRTINYSNFLNPLSKFLVDGDGPVEDLALSIDSTNGNTLVKYRMSYPGKLTVRITDFEGAQVRVLFDGGQLNGSFNLSWDGKNEEDLIVADGYYFVEFKSDIFIKNQITQFTNR